MKKSKLELVETPEFFAIGLVCTVPDYKLAFEINNLLRIEFEKTSEVFSYHFKTKKTYKFEAFIFDDDDRKLIYFLVKNYNGKFWMLPELKQADYVFILAGLNYEQYKDLLKKTLSELSRVQSTFAIAEGYLQNLTIEALEKKHF